jgi:hypothetical protein
LRSDKLAHFVRGIGLKSLCELNSLSCVKIRQRYRRFFRWAKNLDVDDITIAFRGEVKALCEFVREYGRLGKTCDMAQ